MRDLALSLPGAARQACRVCVGAAALDRLVDELPALAGQRLVVLVADSNVSPLHAAPLARRIESAGLRVVCLEFPAGEQNKTRETKARLEDRLIELGAGRDSLFLAVGGGVTGDLTGFLAATWHRGVPLIQVPTSLLAMADSALGGKTAVDLPAGKNLVGAFHQPRALFADVNTLQTLDDEIFVEGLAEMVKMAVVADARMFRTLETASSQLLGRDAEVLEQCLARCLELKGRVVRRDPLEAGRRAVLNFGHTIGHALEAVSGYRLRHGRAVAIGMCVEAALACRCCGFPETQRQRLRQLLATFRLPTRIPPDLSTGALLEASRRDKKARGGQVHYALPGRIGRMLPGDSVMLPVDEALVAEVLDGSRAGLA